MKLNIINIFVIIELMFFGIVSCSNYDDMELIDNKLFESGINNVENNDKNTYKAVPYTPSNRKIIPPPLLPNTPRVKSSSSNEVNDIVITDEKICFALTNLEKNYSVLPNFSKDNIANLKDARKYFCDNNANALKKLRNNSYNGLGNKKDVFVDKVFEFNDNTGSYLATATASKEANIKLDVYSYLSSSYCSGFETYKSRYGADNVKEIDFIKILKSSMFSYDVFHSKWCSFHLKSKPIFFVFTPEYKGVLIQNMFFNNKLFIELNYLTDSINLVQDFLAVSIAYNNPDGSLSSYSYRFMSSVKTAFHDMLVKSTIDKAKDIVAKRFEVNKRLNTLF